MTRSFDSIVRGTIVRFATGGGSSPVPDPPPPAGEPDPVITSVTPSSATTRGNSVATLAGTNFVAGATLAFGGTSTATLTVVSSSQITCTIPSRVTAGRVDLLLTQSSKQTTLPSGFTYIGIPTISAVAPASGVTTGGTSFTLSGTEFASPTTVRFGSDAATNITVVNEVSVTGSTPSGSVGTVNVTAQTSSGTATLTDGYSYVAATGALAEPVYSASNPDHVSHLFDDFQAYTSVASMLAAGTTRPDGGGRWDNSVNTTGMSFVTADPYTGNTQSLRINSTLIVNEWNPGIRAITAPRYVNVSGNEEVVVIEWVCRKSGAGDLDYGKEIDWNNFSTPPGRFHYVMGNLNWLGDRNQCAAANLICDAYYDNNGATPAFSYVPATAQTASPTLIRVEGNIPTQDPNYNNTIYYKQNAGYGTGTGQFNPTNNADQDGGGAHYHNSTWRIHKIRYTREQAGQAYGRGRIEMWIGTTHGSLLKVWEWLGDEVGGLNSNRVFVGPRVWGGTSYNFINTNAQFNFYYLTDNGTHTQIVDVAYVRMWSHPFQAL